MYIDVMKGDFRDAFRRMGRHEAWSYEGLGALYDYLIELEEDSGEKFELDVIWLDCAYSEVSASEFKEMYGCEPSDEHDAYVCKLSNGDFIVREV